MTIRERINCPLQYLIDKILVYSDNATFELHGNVDTTKQVKGISLYSADDSNPDDEFVYMCHAENLRNIARVYKGKTLLCVSDDNDLDRVHVPEDYDIVVVNCSNSFESLYNNLQKVIVNIEKYSLLMDQAILEQGTVGDFISIAEQALRNPFFFLDASHALVGWSKNKKCADRLYQDVVSKGFLPFEYVEEIASEHALGKISSSKPLTYNRLSDYPIVISTLIRDGIIVGYGMLVCSGHTPQPPMVQAFEGICGKISQLFPMIGYKDYDDATRFYLMLLQESADNEEIESFIAKRQISSNVEYVLHVIAPREHYVAPIPFITEKFKSAITKDDVVFVFDNHLLFLEQITKHGNTLAQEPAYGSFLSDYQVISGISAPFYKIQNIGSAYTQACLAIKVGEMLSERRSELFLNYSTEVFRYARYVQYSLIEREYQQTRRLPVTCLGLVKLIMQDRENGTDYARTLCTYLMRDGHIAVVAEELYLHRNSLSNRMKHISSSLGVDLLDVKVRDELLFNFQVIDYAIALGESQKLAALV